MKIRVGAVSTDFTGDRFQTMEEYIRSARLDLICFPEGYFGLRDEELQSIEIFSLREIVEKVSRLSEDYKVHIVTGFIEPVEKDVKSYWNKALLFSPEKGLIGSYTKTTSTPGELRKGIQPGHQIEVFGCKIGKIAMLICFEVWFPELARIATLKGADIICFPSGGDIAPMTDRWETLWKARAIENNVYVIGCLNAEKTATSMICGPEGTLASSRKKGLIQATLDLDRLRKIRRGELETETQHVPALLKKGGPFIREIWQKLQRYEDKANSEYAVYRQGLCRKRT
jgi:predicted amidohydrolase